jgi:hypothetical protein
VEVIAVCPDLTVVASLTSTGRGVSLSTVYSAAMAAIPVSGSVTYAGDSTALKYTWEVYGNAGLLNGSAPAHTIADAKAINTTVTPEGSGIYFIVLKVDDGCRTVTSAAVQYTVTCNQMPASPSLTASSDGGAQGPFRLRTTAPYEYPSVTVTAQATDSDGDAVNFRWAVEENGVALASLSGSSFVFPAQTGRNETLVIKPDFQSMNSSRNFVVRAYAKDPCQENPLGGSLTVPFTCEPMATGGRGGTGASLTPTGTTVQPFVVTYNFGTSTYPSTKIDGSASTVVYTNNRKFDWCIQKTTTSTTGGGITAPNCTATSNVAVAITANDGNSASFDWVPDASVPTAVDQLYLVTLKVSDGCSESSQLAYVNVVCSARPTAILTVSQNIVEWSSNTLKFPSFTGNGSTSQMAGAGQRGEVATSMTYAFTSPTINATVDGAIATYQPTKPGSYDVFLTVANGPCRSVNTANETVRAQCMNLFLDLKNGNGNGNNESPRGGNILVLKYSWDGVRFPTSCMDGTGTRYETVGDNKDVKAGIAGNFNALSYTWLVKTAPKESMLHSPTATDSAAKFTYTTVPNSTKTSGPDRQGCETTEVLYTQTSKQTVTTTQVTLFNHHYNKPITCFVPDVPGKYLVELTASDTCPAKSTYTADIETTCPTRTQPQLRFLQGGPAMTFNGTQYGRVTVDARQTQPQNPRHTLTYSWTLEYTAELAADPANIKTWSMVSPDNAKKSSTWVLPYGNVATFVPDKPGLWRITVAVNDGCPRCSDKDLTETKVIEVTCSKQNQPLSSEVRIGKRTRQAIGTDGKKTEVFQDFNRTDKEIIYDGASKSFAGQEFVLIGKARRACVLKESRWALTRRSCTNSSTKPPPPPTASCKHQCRWLIVKYPEDNCPYGEEGAVQHSERPSYTRPANPDENLCLSTDKKNGCTAKTAALRTTVATQAKCAQFKDEECEDKHPFRAKDKDGKVLNPCRHCTDRKPADEGNTCDAQFKCGRFGTYTLKFVVSDGQILPDGTYKAGCQSAFDYQIVTCRCETRTIIELLQYESIFQCTNKVYQWAKTSLKPAFPLTSRSPRLPSCKPAPRAAPAPVPSAAPTDRCCPADPTCPTCPRCPRCPPCTTPGSTALPAEESSYARVRQRALLSMEQAATEPEITTNTANGVVGPISAVLILSMLANIVLYNRIQRRRSNRQNPKEVVEATML